MLTLNISEQVLNNTQDDINRVVCSVRRFFRIDPRIEVDLHTYQFMSQIDENEVTTISNKYSNIHLTACFIEYLKTLNQLPLKYSVDIDGGNNFVDYLFYTSNCISFSAKIPCSRIFISIF